MDETLEETSYSTLQQQYGIQKQTICKPVLPTTLLKIAVNPKSITDVFDNGTTPTCLQYEMSAQSSSFPTVSHTSQALSWHAQIGQAAAPSPHSALCMPQGVPKALKCAAFCLDSPLLHMSESSNTHELYVQAPDAKRSAFNNSALQLSAHKYHHMSACSRRYTAA